LPPTPEHPDVTGQTERLLTELLKAYDELSALAREQRGRLSCADGAGVERCAQRQFAVAQRIAALDVQREALGGSRTATLSGLVERAPEQARGRLSELIARLKVLAARVNREYRVVHAATRSLITHMDGIVQQVARRLSRTGTYGRAGRVEPGRTVAGGIDMTL
jgi:hypothetical protein